MMRQEKGVSHCFSAFGLLPGATLAKYRQKLEGRKGKIRSPGFGTVRPPHRWQTQHRCGPVNYPECICSSK